VHHLKIRSKLALMLLLPLGGLGLLVALDVARANDAAQRARTQRQFADVVVRVGEFVHAVQDERTGSANPKLAADLAAERAKTDTELSLLRSTTASVDTTRYTKQIRSALAYASRQVDWLAVVRNGITARDETPVQVLDSYGDLVGSHLDVDGAMGSMSADVETARRASSYLALAQANEQLALSQAANVFGLRDRAAAALAEQRAYAEQFARSADSDDVEAYKAAGDSLPLVRAIEDTLAADLQQRATDVRQAAVRSETGLVTGSSLVLVIAVMLAAGLGRDVVQSLGSVTRAARQVADRDLRVDVAEAHGDFGQLALAFREMIEHLRAIIREGERASRRVEELAATIASSSEQLTASGEEVTGAVATIAAAATEQLAGMRSIEGALADMERRADEIMAAASGVLELGDQIASTADESRVGLSRALALLVDIGTFVDTTAGQVDQLATRSEAIEGFASTITRVAKQSALLALNAAIEAARAGEAGRGFAVVAGEMRQLAEDSAKSASEITDHVRGVRDSMLSVVSTMEQGRERVVGVQEVSRDAERALERIGTSVERVRVAAQGVAQAASDNRRDVTGVNRAVAAASAAAAAHASGAEQVAASAHEQTAVTQNVSATGAELLEAVAGVRSVIAAFRT
jgi:methyl-accepting chemotaxis protein